MARSQNMLDVAAEGGLTLGLDIGATKLAAGVVGADGLLRSFARDSTPTGWGAALQTLIGLGRQALADAGVTAGGVSAIGIGCGGPLDTATGVVDGPPNLPGWDAVPVADIVGDAFGGCPTVLENDANAAALAAHRWGPWAGTPNLVYVTVSSGLGSGVIVDGRLLRGASGNGGEIGHTTVDWRGRRCGCGQRGCAEAYVSGNSIARRAREAVAAGAASTLAQLGTITAVDVAAAARAGDALATDLWAETTAILGRVIGSVLNIFEPNVVILGGGVTDAGPMLLVPVRFAALQAALPPARGSAQVVVSPHGRSVGVLGAAAAAAAAARAVQVPA